MASRWLLFLWIFCSLAFTEEDTNKPQEPQTTVVKPSDSEVSIAPKAPEQAEIAAHRILGCGRFCNKEEVKKAADKIIKNGYKIKLKGRSYNGMVLKFKPSGLPDIITPPQGLPEINNGRDDAKLAIALAASIPEIKTNPIGSSQNNPSTSLRDANISNGGERETAISDSGRTGEPSQGHASGSTQGGYTGGEALLNESPLTQAQNKIKSSISAAPSSYSGAPLAANVRSNAVDSMIDRARNSIYMPQGKSNLTNNPLYKKVLDDDSGKNIDANLTSLVKKDLYGKDLKSNFSDIKDIALSKSFQQTAAQFIGKQKLNDFNLAALGAEILMENDSTAQELLGINKSLGSPYDKTIAQFNLGNSSNMMTLASGSTGTTNYSVFAPEDWIERSRFLSDSNKRMPRPENFDMTKAKEGMKALDLLIVDLKKYNSLDLLNAVTVPMSDVPVTWTKEARERILLYLARMRTLSTESITDNETLKRVNEFKAQALALQKELVEMKVMLQFYNKFEEFYAQANNQSLWEEYASDSFIHARRSLAMIRFSLAVNGLRKKNFNNNPSEPLSYLITSSFSELSKEKIRKKRAYDKEQKEDSLRLAEGLKEKSE